MNQTSKYYGKRCFSSGVGDLYTDPQIHSTSDVDYGEANLGTRGMALFFSSHRCNK